MTQVRRKISVEEFRLQASLLAQVDAFRLQLLPRVEDAVERGRLDAIYDEESLSIIWSESVHYTAGDIQYFAFVGNGLAVLSPVSDAGDEVQVDLAIGLTPSELATLQTNVCSAIEGFGSMLDGFMPGLPALVVPARFNRSFATKGSSK